MQFLLPFLYTVLFLVMIRKLRFFEVAGVSRMNLLLLFILKLVAGAAVLLVYTYYYSGSDFYTYFSDSTVFIQRLMGGHEKYSPAWSGNFENVLFASSRIMILLNAALQLFSFGNFYVHAVFFCFFSFLGLVGLLKAFLLHFPGHKNRLLPALFFIPGVLFWGSAVLKESLIIGIVGLLIYLSDFGLRKKYTVLQLTSIIILLALLLFVKIYVLLALLPILCVNILVSRTSNKLMLVKYGMVSGVIILFAALLSVLQPDYNPLKLIRDKQAKAISEASGGVFLVNDTHFVRVDYKHRNEILLPAKDSSFRLETGSAYTMWNLDNMSDTMHVSNSTDTAGYRIMYSIAPAHSVIAMKRLKPGVLDFIGYTPIAFVNTLIHPTIFEITSPLHLLIAIENLAIIVLILLSIIFFDKTALQKKEILLFCLVFATILFVLIGITTPATGAMVRYKTIAVLLLVPALMVMIRFKRRF